MEKLVRRGRFLTLAKDLRIFFRKAPGIFLMHGIIDGRLMGGLYDGLYDGLWTACGRLAWRLARWLKKNKKTE
jgi:hypothetical protein